jgi:hypothetical protein
VQISREKLLYPFHLKGFKGLLMLTIREEKHSANGFSKNVQPVHILFIEQAGFTGDSIINFHNIYVWTGENPPCCCVVKVS